MFYIFFISDCVPSKDDSGCCTDSYPCSMGEGDCDSDSECYGNLICGTDNCQNFDSAYSSTHDCCTTGNKTVQLQLTAGFYVMPVPFFLRLQCQ